jgi:hypothetical protein
VDQRSEWRNARGLRSAGSARIRWIITLIAVVVGIGLLLKECGTRGRIIGDVWYGDDAPASLQPHGNDPGERVPVTENARFLEGWGEKNEFIGRRVTLSGTVDGISHEYREMTLASAEAGGITASWRPEDDPRFRNLEAGSGVRISGIYRLRWSPSVAEGNPTWPALEACRIEPERSAETGPASRRPDRIPCPKCGQPLVPIVWGDPKPETFEAVERGEVVLGGCVGGPEPAWHCRRCGTDVRSTETRR